MALKSFQRSYLISKYGNMYKRTMWVDQEKCVYCGRARQVLDHVPAISLLESINVNQYLKSGGKLLLYPACQECNSLLGKCEAVSLYDRLNYLIGKYSKRVNKIEVWSEEELSKMGKNMRSFIEAQMFKLKELNKVVYDLDSKLIKIINGELDEDGMKL